MWRVLNTAMVFFSFLVGFLWKPADNVCITISDGLICCLAILCFMPLFALGAVTYSIFAWKREKIDRPSWDRNPWDWWNDPLQSLFISTCFMTGMAIGSALKMPMNWPANFSFFAMSICAAIGLATGQMIVYKTYRKRIN